MTSSEERIIITSRTIYNLEFNDQFNNRIFASLCRKPTLSQPMVGHKVQRGEMIGQRPANLGAFHI